MLHILHRWFLWFLIIAIFAGCAPTGPGIMETEQKVREAREHVETVERMKGEYYEDYLVAQHELDDAENNLQKKKLTEAYSSADKSLDASKRILQQFYLDTVSTLVEKAKDEIEETTEQDPENPLKDFLPELDAMLAYADQIQQDPDSVELGKVVEDLSKSTQITENIRANTQLTLDSDISFAQGRYELAEQGKQALRDLLGKIIATKDNYLLQFPDKTVTIKIKAVGYTDEVGFREGTNLVKQLIEGFGDLVPQSGVDRRRFLNQRLSTFRAQTIADYFREGVLQSGSGSHQVFIEEDVIGRGEELPPDVPAPHPTNDPRRRICKIYSYVIAK